MEKQRYISSICDKDCIKHAQWTIQDWKRSGKESFELFTCLFVWFVLFCCYFFQFWPSNTGPWAMFPRPWFCMCHCCLRQTFISSTLTSDSLLRSWAWPWIHPSRSTSQVLRLQHLTLCLVFRQCWGWNGASCMVGKLTNNWAISQSLSWLC